jgi:hypothetical protein
MHRDYLPYLLALTLLSLLHVTAGASESQARRGSFGAVSGKAAADSGSPAALMADTVQQHLVRLNADAGGERRSKYMNHEGTRRTPRK